MQNALRIRNCGTVPRIINMELIPVKAMVIVEKRNHGISGIIDSGESIYGGENPCVIYRVTFGKSVIKGSEKIWL